MKNKKILFLIVLILFVFSLIKTCDILNIKFTLKNDESIESTEQTTNIVDIENNYNNNNFQTTETGKSLYDESYIYFGDENYLVKYDITNDTYTPISTGTNIKNIIKANDSIICTLTVENGNQDLKDYVSLVKNDGSTSEIFYKTESSFITSLNYDGNYIYYTNETNNIYKLNINTKEIEIFFSDSKKFDYPRILGIYNSKLLYIDENSISSIDLNNNENQVITNQYSSYLLKPIIYNDNIYMFENFKYNSIVKIDLNNFKNKIIYNNIDKINNFNISDNYLFLNIDNVIYYSLLEEKDKKEYKNFESTELNLTDDLIYFIKNNKVEKPILTGF